MRRLLPYLVAIAALLTAGRAAAMPWVPIARTARTSHRKPPPCVPTSKRRHMGRRHTSKCRRPTKRHRAPSTGGQLPPTSSALPAAASSAPPSAAPSAPAPAPTPAPIGSQTPPLPATLPSAWDEPALSDPTTIELSPTNYVVTLSQSQDYILECPSGGLTLPNALNIWGGHNVVLENCDFDVTSADWAGHFTDQSGTLWMQGVHFGGSQLTGGIQLQEPGATVVLRDVLFDTVYGSQSTNHAELIQTWAGPARLMIDGLTGSTTYQGLFLTPNQQDAGPPPDVFDLRHIDIDDTQGAYALWLGDVTGSPSGDASGAIAMWNVQDVFVDPNPARTWSGWWLWPQPSTGDPTWGGVSAGTAPGGSFVQATTSGATGVDEDSEPPALIGEQP